MGPYYEPMENLALFDALVPERRYMHGSQGSQTMGLLPTELLDVIASFIPQKHLPSFAVVNSQCRAVAIRHMYSTVVLRGSSFTVKSKEAGKPLPSHELPVPEILAGVTIDGCIMLRRLLSNDEHITHVRDFRIVSHPGYLDRPYFSAFVKYIWTNAKSLTKINHDYFPAIPSPLPKPCWDNTLRHLSARHVCWWTLQALQPSSVQRLTLLQCTQTTDKLFTKDLAHITHLEYLWHDWKEDFSQFNFDWIAQVFPNLTRLRIGVCVCWQDQGIPDKIYEGALCKLVSELPFLQSFTVGRAEENTPGAEESFVVDLWRSRPSLTEVRYEWRGGNGVSWRRHGSLGNVPPVSRVASKVPKKMSQTLWTPDPTHPGRHSWWFGRFGLPEESRPVMLRWHQEGYMIPSERDLYEHVFAIVKAELLKEQPCQWVKQGKCECVMCAF